MAATPTMGLKTETRERLLSKFSGYLDSIEALCIAHDKNEVGIKIACEFVKCQVNDLSTGRLINAYDEPLITFSEFKYRLADKQSPQISARN